MDTIYVAASPRDARYTRICVASIRYFYPDVPIRILAGGRLQTGLYEELRRYWNVEVAQVPDGTYGWGFVKLEPLFGRAGERFLVLDSDTILTGPVIDVWKPGGAPFLVDDEKQADAAAKELYYDWEKVRGVEPHTRRPEFVFNSGQWFGTAGVIARDDFAPWLEWSMPRKLRYPDFFMPGEQGVLNYVINQMAARGDLNVLRHKIMHWPGHSMEGLSADKIATGVADPLIVHWAGMKRLRMSDMAGADILGFFESYYYSRVPMKSARRFANLCRYYMSDMTLRVRRRLVKQVA